MDLLRLPKSAKGCAARRCSLRRNAACALAIYEGFTDQALDIARRTWENFVTNRRNVWSQPDVVFAHDGSLGDGELYVRNMSLWSIPFALAGHKKSVKEFLLRLEPKLRFSLS